MVKKTEAHAEQTPPRPMIRLGVTLLALIGLVAATTLGGGAPPASAGSTPPEDPTVSRPDGAGKAPAPPTGIYKSSAGTISACTA